MANIYKRKIPKLDVETSALGLGTWAIGGPFTANNGENVGWGKVNDKESKKALNKALELGVRVIDTADVYGCGHSEELIGSVLNDYREEVILISKFGKTFNPHTKQWFKEVGTPEYVKQALDASLKRLKTDYIDIYLLHIWGYPIEEARLTMEALENLVEEGKIRSYGWSTDSLSRASAFADQTHFSSIESELNIFRDTCEIIALCKDKNLVNLNRTPLAMGLLSGKYTQTGRKLPNNDVRSASREWLVFFKEGKANPEFLTKLDKIKAILTEDGRTLVQGAIGWIWARSPNAIPIPGFKTEDQVIENTQAMEFGPLKANQMREIDELLGKRILVHE